MKKKKSAEQAKPFFARLYKRHRSMVKDLVKAKEMPAAEVIRIAIEKLHADTVAK